VKFVSKLARVLVKRTPVTASDVAGAVPLFPIGCPRSGTTLLAKVLNAHPSILVTNETAVFLFLNDAISKSRLGVDSGLLYGKEYYDLWADHLAAEAQSLIESYYSRIIAKEGKQGLQYWGEKHPHHFECLDFISSLYPSARYIYLMRDPRDAACSISTMVNVDHYSALSGWRDAAVQYETFVRRLPPDYLLVIRYEDFIEDYHSMAMRVLGWLGLDYAPEVDRFVRQYQNVDAHGLLAPEPERIEFRTRSVLRWRAEFSEEEKRYAREFVGDFLARYGYSAD
jgi:hypothetical protein